MNAHSNEVQPAVSVRVPPWLQALWNGRGRPATHWRLLFGSIFALSATSFTFIIGLSTIRWPMPLKVVGIVALTLAALLLFLGIRACIYVILHMGIKRLLIRLMILFIVMTTVTALTVQTADQGVRHWLTSALIVERMVLRNAYNIGRAVVSAPDTISFAVTGGQQPIKPAGVEWADGIPPTPIVVSAGAADVVTGAVADSAGEPNRSVSPATEQAWKPGDHVRVIGTSGDRLRARLAPSISAQVVARFTEGSMLTIIEGPQTNEGRIWWKVRGEAGEGWCAGDFLELNATQ